MINMHHTIYIMILNIYIMILWRGGRKFLESAFLFNKINTDFYRITRAAKVLRFFFFRDATRQQKSEEEESFGEN